MPSSPYAFLVSRERSTFLTVQKEIIGKGIELVRDASGGVRMQESSNVELEEKRETKRVALSVGANDSIIGMEK